MRFLPKGHRKFWFVVMPGVVGIATAGLIFQLLYFMQVFKTDNVKKPLQTSAVFFYVMCFICYHRTIFIRNTVPQTILKPRVKNQLKNNHHFYYYNADKNMCEK